MFWQHPASGLCAPCPPSAEAPAPGCGQLWAGHLTSLGWAEAPPSSVAESAKCIGWMPRMHNTVWSSFSAAVLTILGQTMGISQALAPSWDRSRIHHHLVRREPGQTPLCLSQLRLRLCSSCWHWESCCSRSRAGHRPALTTSACVWT